MTSEVKIKIYLCFSSEFVVIAWWNSDNILLNFFFLGSTEESDDLVKDDRIVISCELLP